MTAEEEAAAWLALRAELYQRLAEHRPTDESKARVHRCVEALQTIVGQLGPEWRIGLFGSAVNGFGTEASDLDATCFEVAAEGELEPKSPLGKEERHIQATSVLREKLKPVLDSHECKDFSLTEEIFSARVPILKFRFEGCLDLDLSCLNTEPLQNTRLLKAYAGLNDRVRDLGVAVKLWAKGAEVCGAASFHLSSYTFTLMALYYMQADPEVALPVLPAQAFEREGENAEMDERVKAAQAWTCDLPLERLLLGFFQFYSQEFYWGSEVASLRRGCRTFSDDLAFNQLRGRHIPRLHVEDPCDTRRNLNCVLGEAEEVQLQRAFAEAWIAVQQGIPPLGLCPTSKLVAHRMLLSELMGEMVGPLEEGTDDGVEAELAFGDLSAEASLDSGLADGGQSAMVSKLEASAARSSASTASGGAVSSTAGSHGDEACSSGGEDPAARAGAAANSKATLVLACSDLEAALLGYNKQVEPATTASASPALKPGASPPATTGTPTPLLLAAATPPPTASPATKVTASPLLQASPCPELLAALSLSPELKLTASPGMKPSASPALKPSASPALKPKDTPNLKAREGDWICPNCGDLVFASKDACRLCKTPKPDPACFSLVSALPVPEPSELLLATLQGKWHSCEDLEASIFAGPEAPAYKEAKPKSQAARSRRMGRMGVRAGNPSPAFQ